MARVKGAMMTRKRRNKVLKLAKGYWGAKSKHFKMANEQVMKSLSYAYTGRRLKKRDFRSLWITRISAACKMNGMNYSTFMNGLKKAGVEINRKMLAELAVNDKAAFSGTAIKLKARGPGRPTCAKTSCAPAFVCVRGAPVAHEVLFLFNTHCIRLCPAAEKLQISCRAGRVCPLLCPPVKAQSDEKPVSHRPVFSVSPPFPPGFFLHLFDIIHPSQRLYRELFTLSTGFSTPSPP